MMTTIYALSLAGLLLVPVVLLFILDRRMQRQEKRLLLSHLNDTGRVKGLRFSSQEILKGVAIGLDGVNRMVVVVEKIHGNNFYSTIINLDSLEACTAWTQFATVGMQQGFVEKKTDGIRSILLLLHLGGKTTQEIPFYRHYKDKDVERPALEKKARQWEAMLAKFIVPVKKRA